MSNFILRMRKKDTPISISEETLERLMDVTDLNKTEVVHLALRQMADNYLAIPAICATSTATNTSEEKFTQRIF